MAKKTNAQKGSEVLLVFPLLESHLSPFKERMTRYGFQFQDIMAVGSIQQAGKKNLPKLALIELAPDKENENLSQIVTEIRKLSSVMKIVGVFSGKLIYRPDQLYAKGLDFVYQLPFEEEMVINSIFEFAPVEIGENNLTMETISRVNVLELEWSEALPFDIFVVLPHNKKILLYRQKGKNLDEKSIEKFKHQSKYSLYIKKSELSTYFNYSAQVLGRLQKDERLSKLEKEKKIAGEVRKLLGGFFAQESVDETQGQLMLENARKVLDQLEDSTGSKKQFANVIKELASQNMTSYTHCRNVATYCALFGLSMGLTEPETLQMGGFLHDLGMGDLPSELIGKEYSEMTESERAQFKLHPGNGAMTVKFKKMKLPDAVMKMILQHHEKIDGSGFPYGLKGDEIHPYAKVCAIADEFDELTSLRYGKQTRSAANAMRKISGLDGGKPSEYFEEKFFGNLVKNFLTDLGESLTQSEIDQLAGPSEIPTVAPDPAPAAAVTVTVSESVQAPGTVKIVSSKDTLGKMAADISTLTSPAKVPIFEVDNRPIFDAIKSADLTALQKLLDAKVNLAATDEAGLTALNYALKSGNRDIARAVLKAKANLNVQDPSGNTPIMQTIESNNYEMFNLILVAAFETGFVSDSKKNEPATSGKVWLSTALNINVKNNKGETALMVAARVGNDQMLEALIDAGADVNVKNSKGESVHQIVKAYNRINMIDLLKKYEELNKQNNEFFSRAAPEQKVEKEKIDIKTRNPAGQPPLTQACVAGNEESVLKLLSAQSEIDAKDFAGHTPLMLAARQGNTMIIRLLLEKSANLQLKDGQGRGPLLHAIEGGSADAIKILVQAGCSINTRHLGATPLMIACFMGDLKVVTALIECGADPQEKDAKSKLAVDYARSKNHVKVVDYIISLQKKKAA
ncbi:MAG: ankyrin repeat domain-containing protein [Pseudomonadota bacterium]|nr:ankyrin repeat domain-containing protein [Pseudomonadota bacterium]